MEQIRKGEVEKADQVSLLVEVNVTWSIYVMLKIEQTDLKVNVTYKAIFNVSIAPSPSSTNILELSRFSLDFNF